MPIEIRHEQFVGLSVVLGDRTVLEGLQLNGFAPRSSGQLAVAASSADDLEGTDEHWIHDLRVVSSTGSTIFASSRALYSSTPTYWCASL